MQTVGQCMGAVHEAARQSGFLGITLGFAWLAYPFTVVTVFHPSDAVGLQLWLQGFVVPQFMSERALAEGEGAALLSLVALSLFQFGVVVLIYRRIQFMIELWPLATFLIGGIANGVWWVKTGHFDPEGALAGLTPLVAAVACHGVVSASAGTSSLGGNKPHYQPEY